MNSPPPTWFADLPVDHLTTEFSLWSADLLNLSAELKRIRPHADMLHVDVADGHFAPSLLFFPDLLAKVRAVCDLPIHVHLMVSDEVLESQIDQFANAGADAITVHVECAGVAAGALDLIAQHGLAAGLALKVGTPVMKLWPYLQQVRFVTLLGTSIGVKGQVLHGEAANRLRVAKAMVREATPAGRVVVVADGGIRHETVPQLREAGADAVVLGSLAFGEPDLDARMTWLRAL